MKKYGLSLLFGLALCSSLMGQKIEPKGQFIQDSMAVGEPVQYSLSVRYPVDFQILMPDSLYDYAPFEYTHKEFFPTRTDSIESFDSVVYTVSSFELDKVQGLKLPVFLIQGNDSTTIFAESDSIFLDERIPTLNKGLKPKTETTIAKLSQDFNYPYLIAFLVALGVVVLLIAVFFGKGLRKKWQIWRLHKKQKKFRALFDSKLSSAGDLSVEKIEQLLYSWKKHAEIISKSPYAKLTSKEINEMQHNKELYTNLQLIDRRIYSSSGSVDATEAFEYLLKYTDTIVEERIKAIENGK